MRYGLITLWILLGVAAVGWQFIATPAHAQTADEAAVVYMFGRDDCGFCKKQFVWLETEGITYQYLNIAEDAEARVLYDAITEKHAAPKVTPVTVVGERVIVGFNGPETTGASIKAAISAAATSGIVTLEDHIARAPQQEIIVGGGCTGVACDAGASQQYVFDLPLLGLVDLQTFSLTTLSVVLGVIDGFNPCAMWVLVTFLVLLSQAGSRQRMIFLAGLFILAQGIMYNLILNVWYQTWDFIALDEYVTPLVGAVALGGGLFFLYRWWKNRNSALVCDISDIESQAKTTTRFQEIASKPITIASVFAILVIAFSVNIIEFACSIGIPQAYTKILELNLLSFVERQWYIFIFTLGYMLDDVVVFALAIWGFGKLQAHGQKYAQLSLLIGGALMLALGVLLMLAPELLVLA
ncbi:glutaredoxin [bacterium]|nr:glutaredoxin [bacterium]|tara:strand:- start:1019 stop:2248 length:1230 start_codon:yes stop_codon:yes gene_type:complete